MYYNPLKYTGKYEKLLTVLTEGKEIAAVSGLQPSAKALLMAALAGECGTPVAPRAFPGWCLFVARDEQSAKTMARDIQAQVENTWFFPAKDFLFYQADTRGTLLTRQRVELLRHIVEDPQGVVVASIDALMDKIAEKEAFQEEALEIAPGQILEMGALEIRLSRMGYRRLPEVEAMGEFAIRGGIADIFPFGFENPVRVEFWDTEVDNLRRFDLASQRSIEAMDEVRIYPASERAEAGEAGENGGAGSSGEVSLADYFPKDALIVLDEPDRLLERGRAVQEEFAESFRRRQEGSRRKGGGAGLDEAGAAPGEDAALSLIYTVEHILERLLAGRALCLSALGASFSVLRELGGGRPSSLLRMDTAELVGYRSSFDAMLSDLRKWQKERFEILLLSASRTRASRLAQNLRDYELKAYCPDEDMEMASAAPAALQEENRGAIKVLHGYLHTGFVYAEEKFCILTETDMFGNAGEVRKKKRQRKYEGQKIGKLSELAPGDYVVHESHGIGIYRGIERITTDGITKDYIQVEYGDGGKLYLPASRLAGIQKYANAEGRPPRLNKLSGGDWQKTRSRVQRAVKEMARELVQLYAARSRAEGFRFSKDSVWQREFEETFPYEETADQLLAIEATKADMESGKIMDRLICGDVGYGKTEIALRASFKAVQDSRQVAYLVPTTILAQQIYNTYLERMKGFPLNVELLCRFRTPEQNRKVVKDLKSGRADVVIGTHRLLSKDVSFKNLGLLVIDEEQRFGVSHKEKIKQLKQNVDVLTLTATPIPRTLHMSLVGIRDMSVLEEPPIDRLPVQTYVMEYDDELVREAIQRELARNGQVYYVHNRVNTIEEVAAHVRGLVPEARVAIGHGQMSETQLENIMLQFISGEIDVLVSTTIIETGLDIPNANTLIIRDADKMGLAQLYQLRGRVGRSSRTAYAFLMYHRGKMLTEESEKRLTAIREFTALGSGIRIAMRDLEIRGAGNVLGAEQHGHMEAVGYELYSKLLREAVRLEKGEIREEARQESQVDCDLDAYIPDSYISDAAQKLDAYRRISAIQSDEDYMDMQDELMDRFGEFPAEVKNLLLIAQLKSLASRAYATDLHVGPGEYRILFVQDADIHVERIPEIVKQMDGQLRVTGGQTPMMLFRARTGGRKQVWDMEKSIASAKALLEKLVKEKAPA